MNEIPTLTAILLLATTTEALVEYILKPWFRLADGPEPKDPKTQATLDLITCYSAAAAGILLCLAYNADLLALVGLQTPISWVGPVITGILAGRGANFIHDFSTRWLSS